MSKHLAIIINHIAKKNGSLSINYNGDNWFVGIEFGQEDEDSPIVEGASYGSDESLENALQQIIDETGW